ADLAPDLGGFGHERQLRRLDESEFRWIVAKEAEVVHGIAVDRDEIHLLLVEEYCLGPDRARGHDVAIREYKAEIRIDDETRCLARLVTLGIKCPGAVDSDRHDPRSNRLQRSIPASLLR